MWKRILELDVKCPFTSHGCLWTGELNARAAHLAESCKYIQAKCKFGCGEKLETSELAEHLEYFCPNRPVTCPHCSERGKQDFISGKHKDECHELPVDCPNNCGISEIKRKHLKQHLQECQLEIIECDYSYAGCIVKTKRQDMSDHYQKNLQLHMDLLTKFFAAELQEKENRLKKLMAEKDEQLQQLTKCQSQEIKKKDKMIAKLLKEKEEEFDRRLEESQKIANKQLDEVVEEFERKYEELKLNVSHLPAQSSQKFEFVSLLHRGKNNAEIWLGRYASKEVAIKRPLSGISTSEILQEAHTLKKLPHNNILTLYEVITTGKPICMILEYMSNGNLEDYLKTNPALLLHQQLSVCKQVACGLAYLQQKLCIHRRVRIDNVLVGENLTCKINDFSSAVFLQKHDEKYTAVKGFKIKVKWSAPEVLRNTQFCLESDVWSYGILMWQVVMSGQEPYPGLTIDEAEQHICTGTHMQLPQTCPIQFYTLMLDCWKQDPPTRLTFEALVDLLEHLENSHINLKYNTDV